METNTKMYRGYVRRHKSSLNDTGIYDAAFGVIFSITKNPPSTPSRHNTGSGHKSNVCSFRLRAKDESAETETTLRHTGLERETFRDDRSIL